MVPRLVFVVLAGCAIPVLVDAAVDREWPQRSPGEWAVYAAGLVVILGVASAGERWRTRRRGRQRGLP